MRLANVNGRAMLVTADDRGIDVDRYSKGQFGPDLASVYDNWEKFTSWAGGWSGPGEAAATAAPTSPSAWETPFSRSELGSPSPTPRQIVAVGLNYSEHAAESGFAAPDALPPTFTKFVSSLTGPDCIVVLPPGGNTDWEVELVVVIGRTASHVVEALAWNHVAGLSVGQDLSERITQLSGPAPQFGLGKSYPNFSPVGPWLVTPDELQNPDDLRLGCAIDGETVQDGRTKDLIFPVASLVAGLSRVITLLPGDLIFTGTPAGVGLGREPKRFLRPGEKLVSWIDGIGELRQTFVEG